MEISSATLAARELALNSSAVNRDRIQEPVEEQEKRTRSEQKERPDEVRHVDSEKQGRIDVYA